MCDDNLSKFMSNGKKHASGENHFCLDCITHLRDVITHLL